MKNGPYELVVPPLDYPGKKYRGRYAYEHHVAYWKKHGVLLKPGEVLHHKNTKKRDNNPDNLELKTSAQHTKEHSKGKTMIPLTCDFCGSSFQREARHVNSKVKQGQTSFFCCRSHQVSRQQQIKHSLV